MDANMPTRVWCTKCNTFRNPEDFGRNKSGKAKKLCNRHGNKRDLEAVLDDWETFEAELNQWNHPVSLRLNQFSIYY